MNGNIPAQQNLSWLALTGLHFSVQHLRPASSEDCQEAMLHTVKLSFSFFTICK